jgi:hypothetical protein
MDQRDLLKKVLEALEAAGVEYILVGSVASAAYGEPRLTLDIDVVAELFPGRLPQFLSHFPDPEYYCSREARDHQGFREGTGYRLYRAMGVQERSCGNLGSDLVENKRPGISSSSPAWLPGRDSNPVNAI